jgi:hypothetical protein
VYSSDDEEINWDKEATRPLFKTLKDICNTDEVPMTDDELARFEL